MPLFEYACRDCGARFEALVQGSQRPECASCGSASLEKQLSTFAAHSASTSRGPSPAPAMGGCGTCGDPRGPGSCRND